jgi:hypothetical protein
MKTSAGSAALGVPHPVEDVAHTLDADHAGFHGERNPSPQQVRAAQIHQRGDELLQQLAPHRLLEAQGEAADRSCHAFGVFAKKNDSPGFT